MKLLAVTACPTGIAHTYIAAEAIQMACEKVGIVCKVETQGSISTESTITEEDIESADACILTTDMPIKNRERFAELPVLEVKVIQAIKHADDIIADIIKMIGKQ